jgi:alkaline phosphatase D
MKYVNISQHGYLILDLTDNKAQSDYYYVNNIDTKDVGTELKASWYTDDVLPVLQEGTEAPGLASVAPFAPIPSSLTGIRNTQEKDVVLLGAYPNPFENQIMIQYYVPSDKPVTATIYDMAGKQVYHKELGNQQGVNYRILDINAIQSGSYVLMIDNGQTSFKKTITKVK